VNFDVVVARYETQQANSMWTHRPTQQSQFTGYRPAKDPNIEVTLSGDLGAVTLSISLGTVAGTHRSDWAG
jgi:hypothetical protein